MILQNSSVFFSLFFKVFYCFLLLWMGWDGVGMVWMWWRMDGKGSVLLGGVFLYIFSGFAIDRSKKYIKTIKDYIKADAVDPQAATDKPPPPPGHNGQVYGTLQPPKPRQIVRCLGMSFFHVV